MMAVGWFLLLLVLPCRCLGFESFSRVFLFPHVPLNLGLRHIHTPEALSLGKGLTVPGFAVFDSSPPAMVEDYVMVAFSFRTFWGPRRARMLTDSSCRSILVLEDPDRTPWGVLTLSVGREGAVGCRLSVLGHLFKEAGVWERLGVPLLMREDGWKSGMLSSGVPSVAEDPNLQAYRRLVLGLDSARPST